jgi:GDP-D-mannose dehydratase
LLEKGYIVHGMKRRASSYNHPRLEHILQPGPAVSAALELYHNAMET